MPTAMPFREAISNLLMREIMPTTMSSEELRTLDAAVRRHSFFSARTVMDEYLQTAQKTIESLLHPTQDARGVTVGFNPATAREALRNELRRLDYRPREGEEGTIKDLSSDARINLVVRTNTDMAAGAGRFIQQNNARIVNLFPALELFRAAQVNDPRDWEERWFNAAADAKDYRAWDALAVHGKMAALKSSGIWQAIGDGAGGYDDTLGNPFPPFAFNSAMRTVDLGRDEAAALGLIEPGQQAQIASFDFATLFDR
jgi:hypothetical protein